MNVFLLFCCFNNCNFTNFSVNLRNQGITILSIGVGSKVNYTEVKCIASNEDLVVNTTDFTSLPQIQDLLIAVACDIPVGKKTQRLNA